MVTSSTFGGDRSDPVRDFIAWPNLLGEDPN